MPSLHRLSGQFCARLALLVLTFVSVATLAFVGVEPPASSACTMVIEVKPLRVLYKESALVAVARVGNFVEVETADGPTLRKTALRLSSLLKGESKERVVQLHHYAGESSSSSLTKNDTVLVFLKPNEEGEGYVSVDSERGVKKLSPDDLKVYLQRLEELAPLMRSEKPDAAALTEWLVRCAEEPATRWEGAYDLTPNFTPPVDKTEESGGGEAVEANPAQVEVVVETDGEQAKPVDAPAALAPPDAVNESGERSEPDEASRSPKQEEQINFYALLTPAQKERLTTALLAAEELNEGDQMLLRLVGNWEDARLVPFSLKHLARMADEPPYYAEDLMRIIANTLNDATLIKFVDDYNEAASYVDLYARDAESYEDEEEDPEETAEDRAARKKEIAEMKAAAVEARFARSGKLRHFLALADQPQKP